MKNLFLLLFITAFLSGCERGYIKNNTLPPLTHTGANTAGCLVNGEVFVPKGKWFDRDIESSYYNLSYFILNIYQKKTNEKKTISIYCNGAIYENIGATHILSEENLDTDSGGQGFILCIIIMIFLMIRVIRQMTTLKAN